jgi:hypothetical protein
MPDYGFLHLGRITRQDTATGNWILESVALASSSAWGPVPTCVPGLSSGDRVVLGSKGVSRDDLIIIAKVDATFPDISDVPGLAAALAAIGVNVTALQGRTTALEGRATALETLTTSHTASISSLGTRVTSLEGRATAVEGRTTALEARVGYVIPVASVAARPTTGLYNGYQIYRTDKNFGEVYDGTAWRVRTTVAVAALSDITNPTTNQRAFLTTENRLYYYTGTAWHPNQSGGFTESITDTTFTTEVVMPETVTVLDSLPSHRYKISYGTRHSNSAGTATSPAVCSISMRGVFGTGPILTTSALIRTFSFPSTGGNSEFSGFKVLTGLTGTFTIGVSAVANFGTETFNGGATEREILVEDLDA